MKESDEIKNLRVEDIVEIVAMTRQAFNNTYLIPSVYRGQGIGEFINRELHNPFSAYQYYVLYIDNEPTGYAEYKIFKNSSLVFLNIIVVDDKYKNAGIGKKLFNFTRNKFISEGFNKMALDVYESNTVAMNWYQGYGFQNIETTGLYEVCIENCEQEYENLFVQNYPQYEVLRENYGFSFLEMMIENEPIKIGVIDKDAILRGSYSSTLNRNLALIKKKLNFEKLYYIGKDFSKELKIIDRIVRMELNLNHDTKASTE